MVPTYNNPLTIERVVRALLEHVPVFVVDDGGNAEAQRALEKVAELEGAIVHHRQQNGGKGAAVKTGLRLAYEAGYTHALQVDADGQHDFGDLPRFLSAADENPSALILGRPTFDETAPAARKAGRKVSIFWVQVETIFRRGHIADPLCGYRVYPLADAVPAAEKCGDRMDFDPEVAVRLVWRGLDVVNLDTQVRYLDEEEGGVSHFRGFRDTIHISWLHTKLCILRFTGLWRWF